MPFELVRLGIRLRLPAVPGPTEQRCAAITGSLGQPVEGSDAVSRFAAGPVDPKVLPQGQDLREQTMPLILRQLGVN